MAGRSDRRGNRSGRSRRSDSARGGHGGASGEDRQGPIVRIDWTAPARADLLGIVDYVLQHDPRAAVSLEERIGGAVAALAEHPARGRPGRVAGTRELVIAGTPYIVPYRI